MAISYFWTINPLECYPTASGEIDVVFTAHWQFHATEVVEDKTYKASMIGTQSLPAPTGSSFTPFNELTLEQVTGWVVEALGTGSVEAMKDSLAKQISYQINPPSIVLPSHWLAQPITGSL